MVYLQSARAEHGIRSMQLQHRKVILILITYSAFIFLHKRTRISGPSPSVLRTSFTRLMHKGRSCGSSSNSSCSASDPLTPSLACGAQLDMLRVCTPPVVWFLLCVTPRIPLSSAYVHISVDCNVYLSDVQCRFFEILLFWAQSYEQWTIYCILSDFSYVLSRCNTYEKSESIHWHLIRIFKRTNLSRDFIIPNTFSTFFLLGSNNSIPIFK